MFIYLYTKTSKQQQQQQQKFNKNSRTDGSTVRLTPPREYYRSVRVKGMYSIVLYAAADDGDNVVEILIAFWRRPPRGQSDLQASRLLLYYCV